MSREFVPLNADIASDWDKLVEGSPDGWVFALAPWQRLILAVEPWGLRDYSFAHYENRRLVAVMPLQWSPHTNRMASSGWGGSGPVLAGNLDARARDRVLAVMIRHARTLAIEAGASVLELAVLPVTRSSIGARWGVNPFAFYGFTDCSQLSQVLDLSRSEDELFQAISPTTKPLLKRALDHGIEVRRVDWVEYLDAYYPCHCETYARTGVDPHPKAYFSGIAHEIAPLGYAVLLAAFTHRGEPIAFHNAARFGNGALYHTGCSHPRALELGTNHLLLWQSILSAKQDGLGWFDVGTILPGTTDPKLKGLSLFKTRFGGETHRFFRCEMELPGRVPAPDSSGAVVEKPTASTEAVEKLADLSQARASPWYRSWLGRAARSMWWR